MVLIAKYYEVFSSVVQSCPTLCDPMDCSMPGSPVLHHLPEFAQTHVHWVSEPSNHLILCHPLLFLPSVFASIRVFSIDSTLHNRWPKHWGFSFNISPSSEYSGLIPFNGLVWSLCSPGDPHESSPTPQFKSINSVALNFLYGPTLTSIHDYWKDDSFD